jgi:hypothetical protein
MSAGDACGVPQVVDAFRSLEKGGWYAPCHRDAEARDVRVNYKEEL